MLKLYNTLSRKKELLKPLKNKNISIYTCGPTVYDYDHLGHAWTYTQADILRRALEYNGYKVKQVINITDVGHLTSDADTGEDKMEKSARKKKKTVWEIADYFTKIYFKNRKKLNLLKPHIVCKATDHIKEMIKLIEKLFEKGYAYKIDDGIYFDVRKFKKYGKLSGNTLKELRAGARIEINPQKKHPADFALWKFSLPSFREGGRRNFSFFAPKKEKRQMEWNSPWSKGFPGWHIECSAMAMKYLGETLDVHTGGEDNVFPHHESEIAQSEAVTGKKFVNFWFHPKFLKIENEKMSKSLKNFFTVADIEKKQFSALALRYLFLTSHYRSPFNFTWQGLKAGQTALDKLYDAVSLLKGRKGRVDKKYREKFFAFLNNDLNIPEAVALAWKLLKDKNVKDADKKKTLLDFDKVLGFNLAKVKKPIIPDRIKKMTEKRKRYRKEKKWQEADELREKIKKSGYLIKDTEKGPEIKVIKKPGKE